MDALLPPLPSLTFPLFCLIPLTTQTAVRVLVFAEILSSPQFSLQLLLFHPTPLESKILQKVLSVALSPLVFCSLLNPLWSGCCFHQSYGSPMTSRLSNQCRVLSFSFTLPESRTGASFPGFMPPSAPLLPPSPSLLAAPLLPCSMANRSCLSAFTSWDPILPSGYK